MKKNFFCQPILLTLSLLFATKAAADFEDTVPTSFGDASVTPPSPVQAPLSAPKTGSASAPSSPQVGEPNPAAQQDSTASEPGGGDFLSGEAFSDIKHNSQAPVSVKAKDFKGSRKSKLFTLTGNVTVIQETLTMTSEKMDIFTEEGLTKPQKIQAQKNVHVVKIANPDGSDKVQAWAEEMEYNLATGKMHLKNGARITRGKNCTILGDILEYDLQEGNVSGRSIRGTCPPANNRAKPKK